MNKKKKNKEAYMNQRHLRHILAGIIIGVMALILLMGCTEPAPAPPPPPPPVVSPPPPPPPPTYFVNVSSLALREGPTTAARMITTLRFNDEVELMSTAGSWGRVRDLRRNLVGWASMRYLQPSPASSPRSVPRRRKAPAAPQEEPPKPRAPKAM